MNETNGQTNFSDAELRRFLLRQTGEAAREAIEIELLTNEKFFERVESAEEDLIDDYATARLSPAERELFENNFLNTESRRADLRHALSLRRFADENSRAADFVETKEIRRRGFWDLFRLPAVGFAGLCLAAFGAWLVWNLTARRDAPPIVKVETAPTTEIKISPTVLPPVEPAPTPQTSTKPSPANATVEKPKTPDDKKTTAPKPALATLILSAGALRGDGATPRLVLPKDKETTVNIVLQIEPSETKNYQAEILTAEGKTILTRALAARPNAEKISFPVSSKNLPPGDYQIKLAHSGQSAGRFYFRVLK